MRGLLRVVLPMVLVLGIVSADEARRRYTAISGGGSTQSTSSKEESGFFLGLEMGLARHSLTLDMRKVAELQGKGTRESISFDAYAVGGKFGYKHFFIKWVGLRGYINVDYVESRDNGLSRIGKAMKDGGEALNGDSITNDIYYGANIDLLINFWTGKSSSVGMFAGFGVGYQHAKDTLWTNLLAEIMVQDATGRMNSSTTITDSVTLQKHRKLNGLYWDIKVGLRVNAATHHDVEFIAKFTPTALKGHFTDDKQAQFKDVKIPAEYKQSYQFMLGYNFVF